jgi:HSP20 family molecular chaperone IbpA
MTSVMTNVNETISAEGTEEKPHRSHGGSQIDRVLLVCVLLLQTAMLAALVAKVNFSDDKKNPETKTLSDKSHHADGRTLASSPGSQVRSAGSSSQANEALQVIHLTRENQFVSPRFFDLFNSASRQLNPNFSRVIGRTRLDMDSQMSMILNQALDDLVALENLMDVNREWQSAESACAVDMREFDDHYLVSCSMSGCTKSDADKKLVTADLSGQLLTISATPRSPSRSESQTFTRRVWLPGPVMNHHFVQARLTNGMLRIAIPKFERFHMAKSLKRLL